MDAGPARGGHLQELDLAQALVKKVLVVANDLDADHPTHPHVEALDGAAEHARAQVFDDAVPARDHRPDVDREIDGFLQPISPRIEDDLKVEVVQRVLGVVVVVVIVGLVRLTLFTRTKGKALATKATALATQPSLGAPEKI